MALLPLRVALLDPRRPVSPPLVTAGLLLALGVAAGLASCRSTPLASADAEWAYVGDASCGSCHADLTASYQRTGMGRAVSRFDPETAVERFDAAGEGPVVCAEVNGYCYQAFVRGDTLYQRETHPEEPGFERVYAASHVIGSGHATRSYMMMASTPGEPGGYLTEMPLTWYVEREIWDLSPGYEQSNQRFERPITLECLTCHNGLPGHETSQNYYTDVPLGIGCERCHGPASAHVAAFESGGEPEDPLILNPADLSTAGQLDVCQQCHLTGETVYHPGEDATTYRPGRPLSAHRAVFVTESSLEDPESFGISSHAERMMRSACFTESLGTSMPMTCTTCHDPHVPSAELPAEHFSAACASCHGTSSHEVACSRPDAATPAEAATGNCVSCHMRSGGTSDIPHVSFTDHWIQREPPPGRSEGPTVDAFRRETPFTLVNMVLTEQEVERKGAAPQRTADAEVEHGIAIFMLYETFHPLPAYLPQAAARLRAGIAAGADRPDARVALGRALLAMDSLAAAERVLADAFDRDSTDAYAALWLGVARIQRADGGAAAEALARAVRLAPHLTEARLKLAEALTRAGRLQPAAEVLDEALRRDPVRHAAAWNDLGFLRLQLGNTRAALAALRRSVALDPRLPTARVNLGSALLASMDLDAADAQFERALAIDPANQAALGNLGVVRGQQGRTADARRLFEQLLALNPADARAAAYLADLSR